MTQSRRHGVCADWTAYAGTRVRIEVERGIRRAVELRAFLWGAVGYPRYEGRPKARE
ncbi:MAG TPA: hypothetical protein VEA69_22630 [Tepidisphaeraceae bacterium]|nr:hypothetical protein [Tepidisphaeraceae bacterium]